MLTSLPGIGIHMDLNLKQTLDLIIDLKFYHYLFRGDILASRTKLLVAL